MANPFVHVELASTDIDKSKSFYRSLCSPVHSRANLRSVARFALLVDRSL